ncbi:uncharacterized protein [Trachinotus anak]|uniref:uncharacterized protein isoform X2 n=1 Tax=Trachinotus anak TaxID=443729 RepID=UPI0039F232DD
MKWTSTPLTVTAVQAMIILPFYIVHSNHKFEENEIDGTTLLGLSERMCERIFPKIKDQVRFVKILSTLKETEMNEALPHEEPDVPGKPTIGYFQLKFPQFLVNALNNEDPDLKSHQRNKCKNALVQALYDTLSTQAIRSQLGEYHHLLQELHLDDGRFQRYLRLTVAQFEDLLARIGARISRMDTNYRRSIPAAERLSICLRYLATGDSFRTIANSFRVRVSTVSKIVDDVVSTIWDSLVDDFMSVPTTDEWRSIAGRFEERWNFPLCCGAVDGKHVVLKAPANSGSQFYNYKGTYSIVLLAVVDSEYRFRVVDVGGYGRSSDGGILANSAFGQALRSGTLHLPSDLPLPGAEDRGPQPRFCCG